MAVKALRNIYQIKVTLQHTKPPIWRRLLVPTGITLRKLHVILQIAMGWTDSHLHQFIYRGQYYGQPDPEGWGIECIPETKVKIEDLLSREKSSMIYEYDFGDGWEHKITLEKILPYTKDTAVPVCLKGLRACPPEDCGGPYGYEDMLAILKEPGHPEYADVSEWFGGGDFDPDFFDIEETNGALKLHGR